MKNIYSFIIILLFAPLVSLAYGDTTTIPLNRKNAHNRIIQEQQRLDKIDGKVDGFIKLSNIEEVNLQVTDALIRKINVLRNDIELSAALATDNEKKRYLRHIENLVRSFTINWKSRRISPTLAPVLVDNFATILKADIKGESMTPYLKKGPHDVGLIISEIFIDNPGYKESKKVLFLKYSQQHPEKIMASIGPYIDESFADELVLIAYQRNPSQIYSYAQSVNSPQGRLLRRSTDNRIKTIVDLSERKDALFYFPFLDDLISGTQTIDSISKFVGTENKKYDSVGYYKLLVRTEIDYYNRLTHKDTPVAMLGVNGLTEMLQNKAIQHFIKPINDLHDVSNPAVRFKAIAPLNAQDLYYMIVLGDNEIFTSSYKYAFDLMIKKLGPKPRGDSLLMSVNFDHFKKFIKMAAGYNRLDTFLRTMKGTSEILMRAFVANLESSSSLEDAVDVADSYGSIRNPVLLNSMLKYVNDNEQRCVREGNPRGKKIYNILKMIFLSADSTNHIDLTQEIGIPPVYTIDYSKLADDTGRVIEQVFFYGDKDGRESYASYLGSFPPSEWKKTEKKQWIEIRSIKGKPILIFANRPLDNEKDKDAEAQTALINYLDTNNLRPSVVIHRGHSYHLKYTIEQMPESAKIIMLGSCGGYNNLSEILKFTPEAHIISTKQIGARDVNKPIIEAINNTLRAGKNIDWRNMWSGLEVLFAKSGRSKNDLFDDYIPPHKNLGALFLKATSIADVR